MAIRPNGVPGVVMGSYRLSTQTAVLTGTAAAAPLYAWTWQDSRYQAVIRHLKISMQLVVPFTAAQELGLSAAIARTWTALDTGGATTGAPSKLRALYGASKVTDSRIGALTAGTRTLDANVLLFADGGQPVAAASATGQFRPLLAEYTPNVESRYPAIFAQNEGLVVANFIALGAGGSVRVTVDIEWDEFDPERG